MDIDNISSPRIEPLGPDADREPEQLPSHTKRKVRVAPPRIVPLDIEPSDDQDLDQDDTQNLELNPGPNEKHHLDERV